MGEQDRALHEISDARARLSELADELARKAEPDRLKALAHEKAEELKVRAKEFATEKAVELKQHAKDAAVERATEFKTHAKETVMQRTTELKERADTPKGWSLLGALLGAGVGSALMRKAFTARHERWSESDADTRYGRYRDDRWREEDRWRYDGMRAGRTDMRYSDQDRYATSERTDVGYGAGTSYGDVGYQGGATSGYQGVSSGYQGVSADYDASSRSIDTGDTGNGGMKARAGEMASNVKDRAADAASNVKDRAADAAHNVRDRAVDVKDRAVGKASEVRDRAMGAVDHLRERASHLRERVPERQVMQARTSDWFHRTVDEQPLLLALGGIALGMLASTLVPVSNKERRLIEPAKRRAEEGISQLGDQLNQKLQNVGEQLGGTDTNRQGYSASGMSATSDLTTPATTNTGFGASSISSPTSASGLGVTGTSGASVLGPDDSADALASSPSGSSRIPPLPPLDDMTNKVH